MIILGIESSCDETACGIVDQNLKVYSNKLYSQIPEHAKFGGVVPEIAARAHLEKINPIVKSSLKESGLDIKDIGIVAYTRGPGLMGALLVGASFARGLARDLGVPAVGINHLEGHMAAVHLSYPDLAPPYLCLTVSGGHTELTIVKENFEYDILGRTRDDAAGEAFDKCGKILGLGYPAGPVISELAKDGNRKFERFPRGLEGKNTSDFSFSGLKTSVLRYTEKNSPEFIKENINNICASLETAIGDILVTKAMKALDKYNLKQVVLCGGVSANPYLRDQLTKKTEGRGAKCFVPEFQYCTDNGAMIAAAGILRYNKNMLPRETKVTPWLPLDLDQQTKDN